MPETSMYNKQKPAIEDWFLNIIYKKFIFFRAACCKYYGSIHQLLKF